MNSRPYAWRLTRVGLIVLWCGASGCTRRAAQDPPVVDSSSYVPPTRTCQAPPPLAPGESYPFPPSTDNCAEEAYYNNQYPSAPVDPPPDAYAEEQYTPSPENHAETNEREGLTEQVLRVVATLASFVQQRTLDIYGPNATVEQCQELVEGVYEGTALLAELAGQADDEEGQVLGELFKEAASSLGKAILMETLCDPTIAQYAYP